MKYSFTWNILAPYGVRHAFSKLSLPVETNHLPQVAKRNDSTQLSCNNNWYLSDLFACNTSTCEFSMPTANQSPVWRKIKSHKSKYSNPFGFAIYLGQSNSTYQSDSIQVKRFVSWSHAVAAAVLHANPTIVLCYRDHQSIDECHLDWYQCMMHRLCVLGIVAPTLDCVDPKRQCDHHCSMKSILLNRGWLRGHSMLVLMMSVRPWFEVLNLLNPKSTNLMPRLVGEHETIITFQRIQNFSLFEWINEYLPPTINVRPSGRSFTDRM